MTGIGHYIDSLIDGLYKLDSEHDLSAFASHMPSVNAIDVAAATNPGTFIWRNYPKAHLDVWNHPRTFIPKGFQQKHPWFSAQVRAREERALSSLPGSPITRTRRYDVLHSSEPFDMRLVSYKPRHSVATIPDLVTLLKPETYPHRRTLELWLRYFKWCEAHCDVIIAISESTKRDIVEHLKISAERVFVTPLAPRASTRRVEDTEERRQILRKWELDESPFVLYSGTLEPRKNLDRLVRAFARVVKQNPALEHQLVLAGGNWERLDLELRILSCELGIGGRLVTTGYVTNDEMNALMSGCDAFAYISEYEGFGMPPLEAMVCGAPVVVSDSSSLPEVVGDAGLLVPALDSVAIAQALHSLLSDGAENRRRRELSLARAACFSWERTARLSMEAYEAAVAS